MRLEWLEDLLAILDTGTLSKAAEARLLTQPAFSRRIRAIEEHIGVPLTERGTRPLRLRDGVVAQAPRMRELASNLHQLRRDLQEEAASAFNVINIASQHAITTSLAPMIMRHPDITREISLRLKSANRENCYALVMTRQVDIALVYETRKNQFASEQDFLVTRNLGSEELIPVYSTSRMDDLRANLKRSELPTIVYPKEVFLGRVMEEDIFPNLDTSITLYRRAETALTLAGLQFASSGVGVAWVPRLLAQKDIDSGILTDLSDTLCKGELSIAAFRLGYSSRRRDAEDVLWDALPNVLKSTPAP